MFLLTPSSNGSRGSGSQKRPLTPTETPRVSCSVRIGALCWVLPVEDEELLEECGGAGMIGHPYEEPSGYQKTENGLMLLVTRRDNNFDQSFLLSQTIPEDGTAESNTQRNITEVDLKHTSPIQPNVCQRLRKVIQELVDTEKSYVKDLVSLFDIYLTPLQNETFLTKDEMEVLFGSLPEMLDFQRVFLQTLEDRIKSCPNFSNLETPGQFKKLLLSLGGSFLFYADHFKHYSGFCANHIKAQKVLERAKTDGAFKRFLEAKNPTNQHSSSLESYLIKPVQRLLKYPLLLRELVSLTHPDSPEHAHLTEALGAMEKVASHINEMQKIYEDFGPVFDQLAAEQTGPHKQVTEISMAEFLVHSSVVWLNPLPHLGRLRKEPKLTLFVFKRAVVLIYRDSSRTKRRLTGSRSADVDAFRFHWLIPISALQVRQDNTISGWQSSCVWELVDCRPDGAGPPETVFQLCSSGLETKASIVRALRSLISDGASSLRRSSPLMADGGSSLRRRQRGRRCSTGKRMTHVLTEERHGPHGRPLFREPCSEQLSSFSFDLNGRRRHRLSLTGQLESQLQRLNFAEQEDDVLASSQREDKRRSLTLRPSPTDMLHVLEKDFSVQSMASIITEDCFYDSKQKESPPPAKASTLTDKTFHQN
ncbi:rho guanine nucleotide exchange factor TIAM2-like isoform X1 [Takifugu flavidus]|uniref:rho guanine nucleotide exchange factor TIAM2-like isoform X1 n=1 Tax=Takifugu flavidus TaxID=433684 RepID=UPI002544982D|nr:rho guanine nucleotide exchange factor TIAM2-like isoform X1 [Takifugu flavidus]